MTFCKYVFNSLAIRQIEPILYQFFEVVAWNVGNCLRQNSVIIVIIIVWLYIIVLIKSWFLPNFTTSYLYLISILSWHWSPQHWLGVEPWVFQSKFLFIFHLHQLFQNFILKLKFILWNWKGSSRVDIFANNLTYIII